jgi:adenosylhomocysteine nucleosidase
MPLTPPVAPYLPRFTYGMPQLITALFATLLCIATPRSAQSAPEAPTAGTLLDATPRTVVMSAFDAELELLLAATTETHSYTVAGTHFTTGLLAGKPVVLCLSGVSMTNAAMTTQRVLDRFAVQRIVFSGIAGGVNPALHIGDVSVPEEWAPYMEMVMARQTSPGQYRLPQGMHSAKPNYGMMFPLPVGVQRTGSNDPEAHDSFATDPDLLAIARNLKNVTLASCVQQHCLSHSPRLLVGGVGVSGSAFVDNAHYRQYIYRSFHANVLDMESAAVAQVAYANSTPFIVFRSLSDLAGGGPGENEEKTFFRLAAKNSASVVTTFLHALP